MNVVWFTLPLSAISIGVFGGGNTIIPLVNDKDGHRIT